MNINTIHVTDRITCLVSQIQFLRSFYVGIDHLYSVVSDPWFLFTFVVEHCCTLQLLHGPEAGGLRSLQRTQTKTRAFRYSYKHLYFLARIEHMKQLQTCFASSRIIATEY
jgi:hypothetical protein